MMKSGVVLFTILLLDVGILCFATRSLLNALEPRILPFFNYYPVVAARRAPAKKARLPRNKREAQPPVRIAAGGGETFGRYGGTCNAETDGDGIRLSFAVESQSSEAGYTVPLPAGSLARKAYIVFKVRSETGEEVFAITVADDNNETEKISVSRLCPVRSPGEWQEIRFPVRDLGATAAGEFSILFENSQGMPYQGTLDISDIRLME
jgi:hypothetical protein